LGSVSQDRISVPGVLPSKCLNSHTYGVVFFFGSAGNCSELCIGKVQVFKFCKKYWKRHVFFQRAHSVVVFLKDNCSEGLNNFNLPAQFAYALML